MSSVLSLRKLLPARVLVNGSDPARSLSPSLSLRLSVSVSLSLSFLLSPPLTCVCARRRWNGIIT